jgi:hypothetical protein
MNTKYLLQQLFDRIDLVRKAQRAYYGHKADPKTDPLKKQYLAESKRREADLDALMVNIPKLCPQILSAEKLAELPAGAKDIAEINESRMASWVSVINKHTATAHILVAVGGGDNLGQLVVMTTQDLSKEHLIIFLHGAIDKIEKS